MTALPSRARAVVIGGGITGTSVAYHLASRLARHGVAGESGSDQRLDLPRGRAGHPVQSLPHDDAVPPLQHRALSPAGDLRDGGQPAIRIQPRTTPGTTTRGQSG